MTDDKNTPIDDPFDIRDTSMEIDDAVNAGQGAEALETASEPDASNWQSELVRQARDRNLPAEVISKLEGADAVNDLLSIIASTVQKTTQPATPEVEYKPKKAADEFVLDIDEATAFDPDAARALKAMNAFYSDRIRELEARIAERKDADSLGGTRSWVKTLGAEWRTVFGTDEKPNIENIKKLEDSVQTIRAGFTARHKRIPAEQDVLKMALNASFGDRQGEIARNQFTDKVAKRASQIVSRPGTRTASSGNPRMRAAQGVADWFRAKGIDPYGAAQETFE
jgi:hypothetical protein